MPGTAPRRTNALAAARGAAGGPDFIFTLFGVPVTIAYPNLTAWILVAVVFIAAAFFRVPWFVEGTA